MEDTGGQITASGASEGIRPGALTALLQEIAAAPREARGDAWDAALRPGATVGRFELVRELGRGGFGVVWEARDRELGRQVAFKAVRAGGHTSAREERLLREAEAAARLSHPNIVTLFDVGRAAEGPYLVLELLRGETLAERLANGPLQVSEALRVAGLVAKGLAHAHEHGVVHRDLKPENVFLCSDGQVKVLDFGMAHAFGRTKLDGGTLGYMAPEQRRGAPEDERTDVFALGVILHEMLTGALPSAARDASEGPRLSPGFSTRGSPRLAALVGRMLAEDPVRRPRDAAEVLRELEAPREDAGPAAGMRDRLASPARALHAPAVSSRATRPRVRAPFALAAFAVALLSLYLVATRVVHRDTPAGMPVTGPPMASVAVLPFADLSPRRDQEYFSDGLADEILNALAHVEGLHVTGRTSSFSFKGKNEDLRSIGQKLGVRALLEGSVRKDGDRVRITAQLVSAGDGYHLWSESYDRQLSDVFAVQDEIARSVVAALELKLLPDRSPTTIEVRTASPEAHERYLLARQLNDRGSPEATRRAVAELERAIALDPGYAPAWAQLSNALWALTDIGEVSASEQRELRGRALAAADRSVELAPGNAQSYLARAMLRNLNWDWSGARSDVDLALRTGGRTPFAVRIESSVLASRGRLREAIAGAEEAIRRDPLSSEFWNWLGFLLYCDGRLDEGERALVRSREISAENEWPLRNLTVVQLLRGDAAAALEMLPRLAEESFRLRTAAMAHHSLGHGAESQRALDALVDRFGEAEAWHVANVLAWRGEHERALEWLERGFAERNPGMRYVKYFPMLKPLHRHRRFTDLLRKMKLADD